MKKPFVLVLAALLVTTYIPVAVSADDLSAQQNAIGAVYTAQCAAIVADDPDTWGKMMTSDYNQTDPDGSIVDLDKAISELKEGLAQIAISSCTPTITAIKQVGGDMVVRVSILADGKAVSNSGSAEVVATQVDTWTNASGSWAQKADFTVEQKVSIDGKVVQDITNTGTPPR